MALAAVVGVGSNTVRLLVAGATEAGPTTAHTERVRLDLGREIE
jgi:exopolyphosphatase/pppGpp-phosphohydrolase